MKKRKNILLMVVVTLLMTTLVTSCIKDEGQPICNDTNITLTFDARSESGVFDENENVRSLRILIVDTQTGKVDINQKIDNIGDGYPITLQVGLPEGSGRKNFYAVANETSLGLSAKDFPNPEETLSGEWQTKLNKSVDDVDNKYFPKTAENIREQGLPITGFKEDVLISNGAHIIIPIIFTVSKIKLTVVNSRSTEVTVKDIQFNQVKHQGGTLLFQSGEIPEGRSFISLSNITAPANGEETAIFYTYENKEPSQGEGYSVSLTVGGESRNISFDDISFIEENGSPKQITSLTRGQQLNIKVRLLENATVRFSYEVLDWNKETIELPEYN